MNSKQIGCHEPTYSSLNRTSFLSDYTPWNSSLNSTLFSLSEDGSLLPPCPNSNAFPHNLESKPSSFSPDECLIDYPQFQLVPSQQSMNLASQFCIRSEMHREVSHSWKTSEADAKLHGYGNSVSDKRQKLLTQLVNRRMEGLDNNTSDEYQLPHSLLKDSRFLLQDEIKHSAVVPILSYNPNLGLSASSKTRIRWTPVLHDKFVDCVNCLGGAEKATPKGILKLMDSDGLTIYHIKSHLQKYRLAKYMPASSQEKLGMKASGNELQQLDPKTIQITEALRIQLQVQRQLHEHLEIQRNLQIRIEAQSRQLQKLFQEQMKSNKNFNGAQDLKDLFSAERKHGETPQAADIVVGKDCQSNHFQSKIS